MRDTAGQPAVGGDLCGRACKLRRRWETPDLGNHVLMLGRRRAGKASLVLEVYRRPRKIGDDCNVDVEDGGTLASLDHRPQQSKRTLSPAPDELEADGCVRFKYGRREFRSILLGKW